MRCLSVTLNTFEVPEPERSEVGAFTTSLELQNRGGIEPEKLGEVSEATTAGEASSAKLFSKHT